MDAAAGAGSDFPLQGVLWTVLIFFGLALVAWPLVTVLLDVFRREGLSTWERVGWTVLVFFLPLLGSLAYLITRGRDVGAPPLGSDEGAADRFAGRRDDAAARRAVSGPVRPA